MPKDLPLEAALDDMPDAVADDAADRAGGVGAESIVAALVARRIEHASGLPPVPPVYARTLDESDPLARPVARAALARYFDEACYLDRYADLRAQKAMDPDFDPLAHFLDHGVHESRQPSPMFDIGYVAGRFLKFDLESVPSHEVLIRYARSPLQERAVPNRWFSAWAFRRLYEDLYPILRTTGDAGVFEFYIDEVGEEALCPGPFFDEAAYRENNPEVARLIDAGKLRSGFMHFLVHGCFDDRRNLVGGFAGEPSPLLAERALLLGERETLAPVFWWFDEEFYLSVYPDVHDLKRRHIIRSGLEHFVVAGFAEGRVPHPVAWQALERFRARRPAPRKDQVLRALGAELAAAGAPARARIPMADAVRVLAAIAPAPAHRHAVQAAIWPHVQPGELRGYVDPVKYFALNTDVALAVERTDAASADRHWREHGMPEGRVAPGSNTFADRSITFLDVAAWKSGVNFFGPLSAPSGLGASARGLVAALRRAGVAVDAYDVSRLIRPDLPADLFSAADLRYSINLMILNADQVIPFAACYGTDIFDHRANAAVWAWELPSLRPEWRSAQSGLDLVIAPSDYCARAYGLGTDRPIAIVPYVVSHDELTRPLASRLPLATSVACIAAIKARGVRIVLFVMDASSYERRKGSDLFLALAARFDVDHPGECLFVLKTHSRDASAHRSQAALPANLMVIDEVLDFAMLCRLRALADVYVSPHRGEGFGLNICESIILGVPTVVSDHAGAVGLLGDDYPYLVEGRLIEIGQDHGPYAAGAIWFEPAADDLRAKLRLALDRGADAAFAAVRARLIEQLSEESVGAALKQALVRHCALDAETSPDLVASFLPLIRVGKNETFDLAVAPPLGRHPDTPGIERMGEITMGALSPRFSIVTPTWQAQPDWLRELHQDLVAQSFPSWEWCICDDGSTSAEALATLRELRRGDARIKLVLSRDNAGISAATNAAAAVAIGPYLVMIDHDDRVAPDLLANYWNHLQSGGLKAGILYCDEDKLDTDGRACQPYFKPDWSPEHIASTMYVLHCLCIRKSLFLELGGYRAAFDGAQDYDFVLRAASAGAPVEHVDRLLYHWRISPGSAATSSDAKSYAIESGRRAVAAHAERAGVSGVVEHGRYPGTYRTRPTLPARKVSIIVPTGMTRDPEAGTDRSYMERLVRSILRHPPALDFELRIVADAACHDRALRLGALDPRIAVVRYVPPATGFNFAHKMNEAVRGTDTDRVVLLNDDMEATDDCWLEALLEMLELPGVGCVGGKLLHADGTVQHCGIVMGVNGTCTHVFAGMRGTETSYNLYAHVARNYAAVTGAMMAFRRTAFDQVRGFDERFPLDFNDVDLCLRLQEIGLRIVYTPFAEMIHFESRSAPRLVADELDAARFTRKWRRWLDRDPYYNSNLTRHGNMCETRMPAAR